MELFQEVNDKLSKLKRRDSCFFMNSIMNNTFETDFDAKKGLPEDVFLRISSLTPIPNVDLFILNEKNQLLLSWRDDPYFGKGWHLPGGCIRFKESMIDRVHLTAINELGIDVDAVEEPIAVREVIINNYRETLLNQDLRAHHIAILYKCFLSSKKIETSENIKWFDKVPVDILQVHSVYDDIFKEFLKL